MFWEVENMKKYEMPVIKIEGFKSTDVMLTSSVEPTTNQPISIPDGGAEI